MIRRVLTLAKKELKGYFDSPTAYVLLTIWLALVSYFFFRAAYLIGEASLRPLFELLPWLLLFFIPAVTMRSLAGEKGEGTLEILLSHPISELEVVVGKLVANTVFVLTALALTLPIPLGLALGGPLDLGVLAGQYLGAVLLITGLTSVGLFASSLSRNQTTAFIISLALSFLLIATGLDFIITAVPFPLTDVARQISALTHFESIARGVIGLADFAYFAALSAIFTALSYFSIRRDRESAESPRYRNLRYGTGLIVVVSVLVALISTSVGGRLDLTAGGRFSLSSSTVKLVRELKDPVTITLYASRQLPPEAEVALRDIRDTIVDYQAVGRGRVKAVVRRSGNDASDIEKIQRAGVQVVQFNVVRRDEYQVKQGHLGLTVKYRDKQETIPFVSQTDDLEYQLSGLIRKVSNEKKKQVAFLIGEPAQSPANPMNMGAPQDSGYSAWQEKLREQYEVTVVEADPKKKIPAGADVVVVAGFTGDVGKKKLAGLKSVIKRGGSVLALVDSLEVDELSMQVKEVKTDISTFIAGYGLKVEPKLLFDMQANQPVALGDQQNSYLLPYPFWMKVAPAGDSAVVREIGSVTIPWGQPVVIKKGADGEKLLTTSRFAGFQDKDFNIAPEPDMKVDAGKLKTYSVAVAIKAKGGGRLIVVGNSQFLTDKFIGGGGSQNGTFGLNAIDWLARDLTLAGIRTKTSANRLLVFPSDGVKDLVRYFNLIGVPILIALFGLVRLARRRTLTAKVYEA